MASGTSDAKGCIPLDTPALAALRASLGQGLTPLLTWPGQRCVLALKPGKSGTLQLSADMVIHGAQHEP